jgi:hypothetical protein
MGGPEVESLTDPVLGELRWETSFSWWFTQIRLPSGEWLDVIIDPGDEDPLAFVRRAARLYSQAMEAEREILGQAIENGLLDLYNEWRREDERQMTPQEVKNQLALTFIRIDTITPITLSYDAGDRFGGHSVDVKVNERFQAAEVTLVG